MTGIFDQLTSAPDNTDNKQETNPNTNLEIGNTEEAIHSQDSNSVDSTPYTLKQIKEVSQQLLKNGLLESTTKPALYRAAVTHQTRLNAILEPLDLAIKIDDIRGLAYVIVANPETDQEQNDEQWSHPMVRRQRLNLEQSILIAILRKHFVTHELESGVGDDAAIVHLEDLLPELNNFLGEVGSETRENKRLRNLLEQLKAYHLVSDVNEHEQVTIRPLIAHVANPENLKNLLATIKDAKINQSK